MNSTPPGRRVHRCRAPRRRPAAALLEVVVAVSVLLVAMTVVGAVFSNGNYHVERAERMSQADVMTERLLSELDLGLIELTAQELTGGFGGESIPGMSWKIEWGPDINLAGIVKIDVSIYMGDPDGPEDRYQLVSTTHVYRAEPRNINFETDFGFSQDQIDQLTDAIPGGAAIFDPTDFDPRSIAQLDLETLRDLLPSLIEAFGAGMISGGQLDALVQAARQGDVGALQDMAGQMGAGQIPGAPTGGLQPPGRGGQGGGAGPGSGQRPTRRGLGQRDGRQR